MTQKLDIARLAIGEAVRAYHRSDLVRASGNYTNALLDYLSHAVLSYDAKDGLAFLVAEGLGAMLETTLTTYDQLHAAISSGKASGATAGNCYQLLVLAHMAQLLGRWDLANSFVKLADHDDVRNLSSPFWDEYWRAMDALCVGRGYKLKYDKKLKGQERYWIVYLKIIESGTAGGDPAAYVLEAKSFFERRNRDKTIRDDNYEIDGSGWKPVIWDFRLEALERALRRS